jgi:protein-arginine kinase
VHDAAGINDDYPVGRGVFIEEHRNFIVKVNFEDHIEIVLLSEQPQPGNTVLDISAVGQMQGSNNKNDLNLSLKRLAKLNTTFEKIGFATDTYLGFLSVSPRHLGTAMRF